MDFSNIPKEYDLIAMDTPDLYTGTNIVPSFPTRHIKLTSYKNAQITGYEPDRTKFNHSDCHNFRFARLLPQSIIFTDKRPHEFMTLGMSPPPYTCFMITNVVELSDPIPIWVDAHMIKIINIVEPMCTKLQQLNDEYWETPMADVLQSVPNMPFIERQAEKLISFRPNAINAFANHTPHEWEIQHSMRNNVMPFKRLGNNYMCRTDDELRLLTRQPVLFRKFLNTDDTEILLYLVKCNPYFMHQINPTFITDEMCEIAATKSTVSVPHMSKKLLSKHVDLLEIFCKQQSTLNLEILVGCATGIAPNVKWAKSSLDFIAIVSLYSPVLLCWNTSELPYHVIMQCVYRFEHNALKYLSPGMYNIAYATAKIGTISFKQPTPYHQLCNTLIQKHPDAWIYIADIPTYKKHYVMSLWQLCAYVVNRSVPVVYFIESIEIW